MFQNKNITSLIKYLFSSLKNIIMANPLSFISLVVTNSLLLIFITLSNTWLIENINIFNPLVGIIILRISVSLIISGLWIGYFKLILEYLDNDNYDFKHLFSNFHFLPKVITLQSIYYITLIPLFLYLINKFPYNIEEYGTDFNSYFLSLITNLSNTSITISYFDIIILIIASLIPVLYLLKFWCVELVLIDDNQTIKNALKISYNINVHYWQLIALISIIFIMNIASTLLGYFIFIIMLTISYIILFQYYRLIKKQSKYYQK